MADRNDRSGNRDNERMGRGVKEGLNAGQSRNAHDSGSRSGGMQGAPSDRGRGGYGDDSGFTGGSRASRDEGDEGEQGDALEHSSPRAAAPGSEGANVEDHSRIDGVGHQAPSGMDERESSGETR